MSFKRLQILRTTAPVVIDSNITIPSNTRVTVMGMVGEDQVRVRTSNKTRFVTSVANLETTKRGRQPKQLSTDAS